MKRNNIYLIAFTVLFLSSCGAGKMLKTADDLYEQGSFYNAVDQYEEAFEKKENNSRITYQIAETNRQLKDYKQAEKWYAKTVELNEAAFPEAQFQLAEMQKAQGNYDAAIDSYKKFMEMDASSKDEDASKRLAVMKKLAKVGLAGAEMAEDLIAEKPYAEVEQIDGNLNNTLQDLSPKYVGENQVLMAALLPQEAVNLDEAHEANDDYYTKMYYATLDNGTWERELLPDNINSDNLHVGNGVLSSDGNTLYFTKCDEDDAHRMNCAIYMSKKEGGSWSDPDPVSSINKKNASTTQPAIGKDADGNDVLYFASNRTGSKGGFDIYYSVMEDGAFTTPQKLGGDVNTKGDELTPFYDATNGKLYFSSTGHPGLGGLDVFTVEGNVGSWSDAITNAGSPINSAADDLYLALNEAGSKGYMVSNRSGATSTRGENCCDDVFKVNLVQDVYIAITAEDEKGNPVDGVDVALYTSKDGDFDFVGDGITADGSLITFLSMEETDYKINGNKDGYWPSITNVSMDEFGEITGDTLYKVIVMKPIERVKVQNVYFAFDKFDLRTTYKAKMDSVYDLLEEYEELILRIGGHTDSKGSDAYNQKLSEKRAQEAKEYFLERGVDEERILTKGYGETQPVAPNENPDGSDNEAGRAKNRRVEFKLLNDVNDDLPIEIEYDDRGPKTVD